LIFEEDDEDLDEREKKHADSFSDFSSSSGSSFEEESAKDLDVSTKF
jgi:hypothetical protein